MQDVPSSTTDTPRRGWARFVQSRLRVLTVLLIVVQLAVWLGAAEFWWLDLFSHFQVQYFLAGLVLLAMGGVVWLVARPVPRGYRPWLFVLLLVTLWSGWQVFFDPTAHDGGQGPSASGLRVLAANVFIDNRQFEPLPAYIRKQQPDVIVLTELTTPWVAAMKAVAQDYPHQAVHPEDDGCFGIGIWSRWPLKETSWERFDSSVEHLRTLVVTPQGPVRLYGLHTLPPMRRELAEDRNRTLAAVAAELARRPGDLPVLLVGDLNCTRFSPRFQGFCRTGRIVDLCGDFKVQRTWPAGLRGLVLGIRIDHILGDAGWQVAGVEVGPDIGSDHYPVLADVWRR